MSQMVVVGPVAKEHDGTNVSQSLFWGVNVLGTAAVFMAAVWFVTRYDD